MIIVCTPVRHTDLSVNPYWLSAIYMYIYTVLLARLVLLIYWIQRRVGGESASSATKTASIPLWSDIVVNPLHGLWKTTFLYYFDISSMWACIWTELFAWRCGIFSDPFDAHNLPLRNDSSEDFAQPVWKSLSIAYKRARNGTYNFWDVYSQYVEILLPCLQCSVEEVNAACRWAYVGGILVRCSMILLLSTGADPKPIWLMLFCHYCWKK